MEQAKIEIEQQRVALDHEKIKNDKDFQDQSIEVKKQQLQAQVAQMFDNNPYNDKIKQVE